MPRYKLLLEYDGGPYHGFQAQAGQPSVQSSLERAVEAFCGVQARVHVAGRTDSGVHATGQVAHFEVEKPWPPEVVRNAINAHLVPEPIAVIEATIEADDFMGRMFQHEVDHLDGILMVERLDDEMRKHALRILRDRAMGLDTSAMEAKLVSAGNDRPV